MPLDTTAATDSTYEQKQKNEYSEAGNKEKIPLSTIYSGGITYLSKDRTKVEGNPQVFLNTVSVTNQFKYDRKTSNQSQDHVK